MFCLNYFGILHCALTFERGGAFMHSTYAIVPVSICAFLAMERALGMVPRAKKIEAKRAAAQASSGDV